MAGERKFTRIPPESTGDRVYMIHTAEIPFDGKLTYDAARGTSHIWSVGDRYSVSGFGTVHVHGVYDKGDGTGILSVHYGKTQKIENSTPANDAIISLDGDNVADVNGTCYDIMVPAQNIMGWDNPEYGWNIDRFGSGQITFADGNPELTEFGELRSSQKSLLGQYMFTKGKLPAQFSNNLSGAGTVTFESNFQAVRLDVGDTNGDVATHTSNLYHPYIPGSSILALISTRCEDTGVTGLSRKWGLFDVYNGFFFSLDDTTLNINHRWTYSGVTNTNSISQTNWNQDTLDGSGDAGNPSGFNLNASRNNTYWVDYQQIGGGIIRYGVLANGERLVCHTMNMSNGGATGNFLHNAIANPNLPICWAITCTSGTPGYSGTKSLFAYGAGVWAEGKGLTDIMDEGEIAAFDGDWTVDANYPPRTQGAHYLFSLRPVAQIQDEEGNFADNHTLYLPKSLTVDAYDENGNNVRGELRIFSKCILKSENFDNVTYTNVEKDEYASHVGHGPEIYRLPIDGIGEIDFTRVFSNSVQNSTLKVNSEATTSIRTQPITQVIGADNPYGTGTCVTIKVGQNPTLFTNTHFFDDYASITIAGLSNPGPANLNGNTYVLSIQDSDEAQLYLNSTDLDDDRKPRVLNITYDSPEIPLNVGDTLTIAGAGTCVVDKVSGTQVRVSSRTSAALDVGLTAAAGTNNASPQSSFTVDSVVEATNTTSSTSILYAWPKDNKTVLNAVTSSGWGSPVDEGTGTTNIGTIQGTPSASTAWTFMWAPRVSPTGSTVHTIRVNLQWKERIQ